MRTVPRAWRVSRRYNMDSMLRSIILDTVLLQVVIIVVQRLESRICKSQMWFRIHWSVTPTLRGSTSSCDSQLQKPHLHAKYAAPQSKMLSLLESLQLPAQHEVLLLLVVLPVSYFLVDCILVVSAALLLVRLEDFHQHVRNPRNHWNCHDHPCPVRLLSANPWYSLLSSFAFFNQWIFT